ncbi:MAG: hypothetical protein QM688_11490 [Sphingomonas bacterium]
MERLQAPDGWPLDSGSVRVFRDITSIARLNFLFVGLLLIVANGVCSAGIFGLAVPFYQSAATYTLLASAFILRQSIRQKLRKFYAVALIVPELGIIWATIEEIRLSVIPGWSWVVLAGGWGIFMNIFQALRLGRYRPPGFPLVRAMLPLLRASLPYSIAVTLAGVITALTRVAWIDLLVGIAIAALHYRAPRLLDRVSRLEIADTAHEDRSLLQLANDYPPLAIILTPGWQSAARTYRQRGELHGNAE